MRYVLIFLLATTAAAKVEPGTLDALQRIESSNRPNAIGDNGKAVGILQIHKVMVREVNRIAKMNGMRSRFVYADRLNPQKSRKMALIFLTWQERRFIKKNGHKPTQQQLAACWNTGNVFKDAPKQYKNKVNKELSK